METLEKKKNTGQNTKLGQPKKKTTLAPDIILVRTSRGNIVSMRRIPDEDIKALRNPAYEYLA